MTGLSKNQALPPMATGLFRLLFGQDLLGRLIYIIFNKNLTKKGIQKFF